jgi:hypothetical protein
MSAPASDSVLHCLSKIRELVQNPTPTRRDLLQLGYNLGRLSELTGLGREPFWDAWKGPVEKWDQPKLAELIARLERLFPLSNPDS